MFRYKLDEEAEQKIKQTSKYGMRDERLRYLWEIGKLMYMQDKKDENGNVVIDPKTNLPVREPMQRKSGRYACSHPYEMAYYSWVVKDPWTDILTCMFHDVFEDTDCTQDELRKVIEDFWDRYPETFGYCNKPYIVDTVMRDVNLLTKKEHFSRPKEVFLKTKDGEIVTTNDMLRGYYWRRAEVPKDWKEGDPLPRPRRFRNLTRDCLSDTDRNPKKGNKTSQELWDQFLEEYNIYYPKMKSYILAIKQSPGAIRTKIKDRMVNFKDHPRKIKYFWLEKYTREGDEFILRYLVDDSISPRLQDDFLKAFELARKARVVRKSALIHNIENGLEYSPTILDSNTEDYYDWLLENEELSEYERNSIAIWKKMNKSQNVEDREI